MTDISAAVRIGTQRRPEKKARKSGNLVLLKRLYNAPDTQPTMMPKNTFLLPMAPGAKAAGGFSASKPRNMEAEPMIVVMVMKPTRPDRAEAPSLSRAMPTATPTANSRPRLSRIAEPVLHR